MHKISASNPSTNNASNNYQHWLSLFLSNVQNTNSSKKNFSRKKQLEKIFNRISQLHPLDKVVEGLYAVIELKNNFGKKPGYNAVIDYDPNTYECNVSIFYNKNELLIKLPINAEMIVEEATKKPFIEKLIKENFNIEYAFKDHSVAEIGELNKLLNLEDIKNEFLKENNLSPEKKEELKNKLSNIKALINNIIICDKINQNSIFIDKKIYKKKFENILNKNELSKNELNAIFDKMEEIKIECFKNYAHELMIDSSLDVKTKKERLDFIKDLLINHFVMNDPLIIKIFSKKEEIEAFLSKQVSSEEFEDNLIKVVLDEPLSPEECEALLSKMLQKNIVEMRLNEHLSKETLLRKKPQKTDNDKKNLLRALFTKTISVEEILSQLLPNEKFSDQSISTEDLKNLRLLKNIYEAILNLNKQI